MTAVKVCGITALDQALWALEEGADLLGFVLAPSQRQLPGQAVAEIVDRTRLSFPREQHPWQAVGVFANQELDLVLRVLSEARLDVVQLSGEELPSYCREIPAPIFRAVHLPALPGSEGSSSEPAAGEDAGQQPGLRERLVDLRHLYGADRLLLDSGGGGQWGGTGRPFPWESVGDSARGCLVAGGLAPANVSRAISLMRPWGVDVSSGVEREGKKDRELIRAFIGEVKRSDGHGRDE